MPKTTLRIKPKKGSDFPFSGYILYVDGAMSELAATFNGSVPTVCNVMEFHDLALVSEVADYLGIEATDLADRRKLSVNDKIAIWCLAFKNRYGTAYKVNRAETTAVANVPVSDALVAAFFDCGEWWAKTKTLSVYCKYVNELRRLIANPPPAAPAPGPKHPDYYDKKYESTLTGDDLTAYWRHLKSKGWTKTESQGGGSVWRNPNGK